MSRVSIREQLLNFVLYLLLQLPLIYRITLFDKAFGFFYLGFILLLPITLNRSYLMLIGFVSGLGVDVFCNTPGIHASASVFIMFIRNFWLGIVEDDWQDLTNLNVLSIKRIKFIYYIFPLVFLHHLLIFSIENMGFNMYGRVLSRAIYSSIFSSIIIIVVSSLVATKRTRA